MYTVLGPFVLTEESCSVNTFSLSASKSKVSIKDQFPGKTDIMMYNIYYERYLFLFLMWKELLFIHTTGCMFYFKRKKFYCCYSYNAVKILEFWQKSWKVLELWCKKSWKVLEFESIFLGGTMYFIVAI